VPRHGPIDRSTRLIQQNVAAHVRRRICDDGMRRRRVILGAVAILVLGIIVAVLLPRDREPEYRGKKLSQWVTIYSMDYPDEDSSTARQAQAREALRRMGTNAIVCSLQWIREDPPVWQNKLYQINGKLPEFLSDNFVFNSMAGRSDNRLRTAISVFFILGPEASAAVPELIRLVNKPKSPTGYLPPMEALAYIGPGALSFFENLLTNQATPIRTDAARYIRYMARRGIDGSSAVPGLIQCLQDTNETVAVDAAKSLGEIHLEASIAVAALTNAMHDSRTYLRRAATRSLGRFGRQARSAVPALLQCLDDPDESMVLNAAVSLGCLALEPDMVVPALVNMIQKCPASARPSGFMALARFEEAARPAVPVLLQVFNNSVDRDRENAAYALGKIAPEVLPRQDRPMTSSRRAR
jgi:hypothetical protein